MTLDKHTLQQRVGQVFERLSRYVPTHAYPIEEISGLLGELRKVELATENPAPQASDVGRTPENRDNVNRRSDSPTAAGPTPRTDAAALGFARILVDWTKPEPERTVELVDANFARHLERELVVATRDLENLRAFKHSVDKAKVRSEFSVGGEK